MKPGFTARMASCYKKLIVSLCTVASSAHLFPVASAVKIRTFSKAYFLEMGVGFRLVRTFPGDHMGTARIVSF